MLIGEASIRLDAIADDLKKTINRDINEALAGVKIDSDPLVKMTQNLRKAELDLITAEDQLKAAHQGTLETEAKLEDLRRSGTATTNQISAAERALTRARAEEAVTADKVTVATQKLAAAHGSLTKNQKDGEVQQKSWIKSILGSSNVIDSVVSKLNIFGRRTKDAGDEGSRTGSKLKNLGNDSSGLGKVLDGALGGALKAVTGQLSAVGSMGEGVFSVLTSKAVLLPAALAPLLGVVGGLITALPALAAVGGVVLGAILLGLDGIKRAFKPLADDLDRLKEKVSASFEKALAPAVAKMPALFGAATQGLQSMATALGGTVTQLTNMLTTSENLAKVRDLFNQTAQFIKGMQPGINAFTQGFLNLASAVAPQLKILGNAFGSILLSLGAAFDKLASSGQVTKIIDGLASVLNSVANLLGPIIELLGRLAASLQGPLATVIDAIANGLKSAMPGIQAFADGIARGLEALAPLFQAVLPLIGQLAGLIGGVLGSAIETLAPPLTKLIQGFSAGLAPILPKIAAAFDQLFAALAPVLDQLSGALIQSLDALLPVIPQLLDALIQLVPIFAQIVTAVIPLLPPLIQLVATILPPLIKLWLLVEKPMLSMALVIVEKLVPALISIVNVASDVVTKVADFFENFSTNIKAIWDKITGFFSGIGDSIGGFFSGIGEKIVGWFQAGIDFLAGLPGKVGDFLSTLPGIVTDWMIQAGQAMLNATIQGIEWVIAEFIALPFQIVAVIIKFGQMLWQWGVDAFNFGKTAVADGITAIVQFFIDLPGRAIDAVTSFVTSFIAWWHQVWDGSKLAVAQGIINVVEFFRGLPARAISAISALLGQLRQFFVNAWNSARDAVVSGVNGVIDFVRGLPGKVLGALGDLASLLYQAGKNIIQGLINGIKAAAGAVGDVVSGVLSKVRKLLPFSPAKEGPFSGRGWTLYSGMAIMQALADGLRIAGDNAIDQAADTAGRIAAALNITPIVNAPDLPGSGVGDLTKGSASTATAQLLTLQALADSLVSQGKTLPDDLAAAISAMRVVVSANEASSAIKTVDQTNERRR